MFRLLKQYSASLRARALAVAAVCTAAVLSVPAMALAVESEAQTKVKSLVTEINTEGIAIFLIVVGGIATLLAITIAVSLGIKKIRSLVGH